MRTLRTSAVAVVLALGAATLPAAPSSALGGVSGPSTPPGTPFLGNSRLDFASDAGVLVGETSYRLSLWSGGRSRQLGDLGTRANAMNASGSFTGTTAVPSAEGSTYGATLWSPAGVATDIAPPRSSWSSGLAIGDDGTVLVGYTTAAGVDKLGLWRDGKHLPLPLAPKFQVGAINKRGQVATTALRGGTSVATRCTAAGVCTALPKVPGSLGSTALDINDAGDVVGLAEVYTVKKATGTVAVLWRGGKATVLPNLSAPAATSYAGATHINNSGLIGGYSGNPVSTAVVWKGGAVIELAPGEPRDTYEPEIIGMNDAGEVVGGLFDRRNTYDQKRRGFLWRDGSFATLDPSFPAPSAGVAGITPSGLIYGSSFSASSIPLALNSSQATTWKVGR